MAAVQIPSHRSVLTSDGKIDQQWQFFFQNFVQNLPPSGSGFVTTDNTGTKLDYGLDVDKGTPSTGEFYFATDTGFIYADVGGSWVFQSPAFTGDVSKPQNSTVLTLATVNSDVGTWGDSTDIPVITVDAKGRITGIITVPAIAPPTSAAGLNTQVQFNSGGVLGASSDLTFSSSTLTTTNLSVPGTGTLGTSIVTGHSLIGGSEHIDGNLAVDGTFNVASQATLSGNLYPTITGTSGQFLETDGAGNLSWGTVTAGSTQTPFHILLGDTFTVDINSQVLIAEPIIVDGTLTIIGDLISVPSSAPPAGVTSIDVSGGTSGLITTGGPITTSGTITIGGILALTNGGTGTSTPNLTSGSGISITGTWPDQTIAAGGGGGGDPALFWSSV